MKSFILLGLVACIAVVTGHSAYSYANLNQISHGGYGGYDGGYGGYGSGYGADGGYGGHGDYYAHPEYKYEYGVKDGHTGDNKDAWEHRDGDVVKGGYSLAEADGTKRVVEYVADGHNGFNAVVKRIGHAVHPQVYGHGGYEHAGLGYGYGGYGYGGHGYGY